ncbi:gag-pol polyprotein [Tanacetum coccineum]
MTLCGLFALPSKLIYGKNCHLPFEIKHRAYWALKNCNPYLIAIGEKRMFQLYELDELRHQAYENSRLYKARTKVWHDRKLRMRKEFKQGNKVLLFHSKYKFKQPKIRSRWLGPYVVKHQYPSGYVELCGKDGKTFIVNGYRLKLYHKEDNNPREAVKIHAIGRMHQPRFNFVFDFVIIDQKKDHELGFAHSEIKALKATDVLKDKSLDKNLDIKKLITKKKEAFAAQFAAEATLRRVHANQKDDNMVPIESIIAPLEADNRMYNNEIAALQEDKKTLERHTKSKEEALLEAERILENLRRKSLWASRSKVVDEDEKERNERILKNVGGMKLDKFRDDRITALMGRLSRWYAMHQPPCQFREYFMTLKSWILQRSRLQLLSQPSVKIQQEEIFFRSNKRCYKISIGMAEFAPGYEQGALADLGASISVMSLSTYTTLGLGDLIPTKLIIELADRTDIKVSLILERSFLSTARGKIDVFKRKITLRVGKEKIIFKSVKPTSSLIKKVYMLNLRERIELDLEARLMGETLVLNRSLDPFSEDYIELNDLNVPLELRRDQVDDLMPTIKEGEVIKEFRARNDAKVFGYPSDCDYDKKIRMDYAYNLKFSCMIVLEDMDAYRDEEMGDVIFGEPFLRKVKINVKRFKGMITIHSGNKEVSEEDNMNGISHSYQKLKGFYKGVLNSGPEYARDVKMEEWLTRGHISDLAERKEIDNVGEESTIWKSGSVGVLKSQDDCST